jgi:hypothetical protein
MHQGTGYLTAFTRQALFDIYHNGLIHFLSEIIKIKTTSHLIQGEKI